MPTLFPRFSAENLSALRQLLAQRAPGHALPQALYTSAVAFDLDMQAIYARQWLQAGLTAEIPAAGNYLTRAFGATSILVLRTQDGSVKAYLNTCRHRGAKLCDQAHGSSRRIVCPYHQWTYDLDGKLIHARNMGDDFQTAEHSLTPVRCEVVAGVIYVAVNQNPPDFAPFRAALEPMLLPHRLEHAKIAKSFTLLEEANWKLVMENARECYHCTAQHPELMRVFRDPTKDQDFFAATPDWAQAFMQSCARAGVPADPVEGDWYSVMRIPLNEGMESLTLDGKPACRTPLVADCPTAIGSMRWAIESNAFSHALKDYAFTFEVWPINATQTHVISHWLVHQDAVEGVDYEPESLSALWMTTNSQDKWLAENNQKGVENFGYIPGPYSPQHEQFLLKFVDWYCAQAQHWLDAQAA